MSEPHGGVIVQVRPNGIGEEIGLQAGDTVLSINGHALRDVIDYRYYGAEEELVLLVERDGQRHRLEIERDYDEDLGLEFAELTFDGMRQCDNRCPFCFVQQMPKGLRRTLYLRDDDYRYSFLQGNFVTLTNLLPEDWQRIGEQHLSPLYVSIHASDRTVRQRVLGNPDAPDVMAQLRRLGELGITVHGQVVVWPGVNDGPVLQQTISDVAALWPTVQTLAVVPVGLTRYHRHPAGVRLARPEEAAAILDMAIPLGDSCRERWGSTWLYPSDELFLLTGRPVPSAAFYDDDAQRENGVGLVRLLLDDWRKVRKRAGQASQAVQRVTLVCGTLIAPLLRELAGDFPERTGISAQVVPVANCLLGGTVTVSGLLGGQDVLDALAGLDVGQRVFLPRAMFDASGRVTLDDLTRDDLQQRLGVSVVLASRMSEVVEALANIQKR
jgi:putative radical SAM enzyme (TIGR03279 family)